MINKIKKANIFWVILLFGILLGILLCALFLGKTGIAAENEMENQSFAVDAQLLPFSLDDRTYNIQVTVSNQGEDWEGTVRVRVVNHYDTPKCAFDTAISLPQGSAKQFVVRIPVESVEHMDGTASVSMLDKKSNVVFKKNFNRLLIEGGDLLAMGILSDSYRALTYLDMEGEELYYGGNDLPIKLVELNQDNLANSLDSLIFLVIDNYNTSVLTDRTLDSIRQWVLDGGALILGTGKRAEDVLSGLDYFGITCDQINEPAGDTGLSQFSQAELKDTTGRYESYMNSRIMVSSWGDGMVELVPYALSELGNQELVIDERETYVHELLRNINGYAHIKYIDLYDYSMNSSISAGVFEIFGNGSGHLNFGVLKWIIIGYVIFVGPVLYLILRYLNKRDLYWIAVPVTTLVGILLVYLAGSGYEVANTRVYAVTIEELSDQDAEDGALTYMRCYDAGHKEWSLQLADQYEYAGPVFADSDTNNEYYYHISKDGDRISIGVNPNAGFEDGYFIAGTSKKSGTGSISSDIEYSLQLGMTGSVTNGTNRDFRYFAVIRGDDWYVFEDLAAGETCSLESLDKSKHISGSFKASFYNAMEEYITQFSSGEQEKDKDIIIALGMGISAVYYKYASDDTVIIGVTQDWDKAVDDNCSETSYGCLYSVQ